MGFTQSLGFAKKTPFEPLKGSPLKYLTMKTVFLVAISTYRRSSDLQALNIGAGNMSVQKRGVTFIRQGLSKSDRPNHLAPKTFVPCFKEDKRLDPKRMLKFYLKQTEAFRSSEKKGIFLSFKKPHNVVSRQTISRWIVQLIKLAYTDGQSKRTFHLINWAFMGSV